jgi:hypothetical protein
MGNPPLELAEWQCLVNRTMVEVDWLVPLMRFQNCAPYWLEWICYKVDKLLNLRPCEETKGRQVEYHRMGIVRVDKKIFGAPR